MFAAFAVLCYRSLRYRRYLVGYKRGKYNFTDILSLNKMGWMVGLQMGLETALFSITGIMIGWLGSIALAAHQVMVAISTLGFMIYYGVGAAVSVRVSNYFGRQELLPVRRTTMAGFHLILCLAVCACTVFLFSRELIGYLFTTSEEVIRVASTLVSILLAYQFGDALQITYANSLRGIGDVISMAVISFIGYFLIAMPVCYICGFVLEWGITGIWIGYPIGLTLTGVMLCGRYYCCLLYTSGNRAFTRGSRISRISFLIHSTIASSAFSWASGVSLAGLMKSSCWVEMTIVCIRAGFPSSPYAMVTCDFESGRRYCIN